MNIKMIASFAAGVVVGGITGVVAMRQFYSRKIDEMMELMYDDDDVNCENESGNGDDENESDGGDDDVDDEEQNTSKKGTKNNSGHNDGGRDTVDLNKIRDKINRNWERTSNYASMYDNPEPEDVDADEDYMSEAQTREEIEEEEMFDEYQNNRGRRPKIISLDDYSSLPGNVDTGVLYYHRYDAVLVDEADEVIDEPERLIGDSLTKYGWDESEESRMYVMNYDMNTAFEVVKVEGAFKFPDLND